MTGFGVKAFEMERKIAKEIMQKCDSGDIKTVEQLNKIDDLEMRKRKCIPMYKKIREHQDVLEESDTK